MPDDLPDDPMTVFEEVWAFTDKHYSFFAEKEIDWQAVYDEYVEQVDPDMDNVALFDLCADMLFELRDGHVNLLSPFDRSRNWEWYLDYPDNFSATLIERQYMQNKQRILGPLRLVRLDHLPEGQDIVYVYYGSFGETITDYHLDVLMTTLLGSKGLILDVRSNGGGDIENARRLVSRFIDHKVFVGTNYLKSGPMHEDFRIEEVNIAPHEGSVFMGNVVVLTNRRSYSATTYFAQYMKAAGGTLMGDATGGGGGIPAFWDLPNGWLLRVSSSRFYSPEGESIEPGVAPHRRIDMYPASILEGRDDILDAAMEHLSNLTP